MSIPTADARAEEDGAPLIHRLAEHVSGLAFETIPSEIVGLAKDHLVHHVGLALAAVDYPRPRRARAVARRLSGQGGRHRILGTPGRYGLLEAVFANSLLMGADALDDAALGGTHPGVLVFPTAMALPETRTVSGRDLLAAVVAGYDVLVATARGGWTWGVSTPRRSGCVVGPLGVAAVASRLLGLGPQRTAHALGLAANGAVGLIEGTPFAGILYPHVTRSGVMATFLAADGHRSTPSVLDGPYGLYETYLGAVPGEVVAAMDALGSDYGLTHAFRKRYACSGFNVVPVELMDDLVRSTGVTVEDVASIRLALPEERRPREEDFDRNFRRYRDDDESLYITRYASPRFLVAAWLWDGRLNPARYREDMPAGFVDLLARTSMDFVEGLPLRSARLTVVTTDGQEHVREGHDPSPTPPMDYREWLADLLPAAPPSAIEGFVTSVDRLEESRDASELWTALDRFAERPAASPAISPGLDREPGSTASQRIAAYVTGARYEDFPPAVIERGKDLLVHHLGLALADRPPAGARPGRPPGNYSAIGRLPSLRLLDVVFANSLSMQTRGRQDSMAGGMRPGALIIPAALALTEERAITGKELLVAIAVGYDAGLALSAGTWAWGAATARRADCVFGPVAVACTAARLLGLDEERTADAIGQACHLTMGLIEGVEEEALINAQLARNGVYAAILAEAGFPAADLMIEGEFGLYRSTLGTVPTDLDRSLSGLGTRFGLERAVVSRHDLDPNHLVPVELTSRLGARLAGDAGEPVEVEVLLPETRRRWDHVARTRLRGSEHQVSQAAALRRALAKVLAGGPREEDHRANGALEGAEPADGVALRYEPGRDPWFARVTVTTASGHTESLEGDRSILPLHLPDRRALLLDSIGGGNRSKVDEAIRLVGTLETVRDASTLLEVMVDLCG
ncbi:MAG: MmgE/PrpD family protein [bacterium]|nr:MmgE/PrpD family protein [bacterium]